MLGWSPTWDFETTIAKTVAWYTDPRWERAAEDLTLWRGGGALQHFERARPVRRQKQSVEFLELRRAQRVG